MTYWRRIPWERIGTRNDHVISRTAMSTIKMTLSNKKHGHWIEKHVELSLDDGERRYGVRTLMTWQYVSSCEDNTWGSRYLTRQCLLPLPIGCLINLVIFSVIQPLWIDCVHTNLRNPKSIAQPWPFPKS